MKVLLLEDEYSLRISVEEFLEDVGFEVDGFGNGEDAYNAIYETNYDILLLDVNVPGRNGFELLHALRNDGIKIPAIFLTSMTTTIDLKKGYETGCCDYIRKPFDLTELQLRIQQALNSFYHGSKSTIELAEDLVYDTKSFCLTYHGEKIELSKIEKDLLGVLIKHKNQVVSMGMLQDEIWGEYVDPMNIRVHVKNLRKKLPVDIIQTRRGIGYLVSIEV